MTKEQLRQYRREIHGLRDEIYQLEQSNKVRRSRATRTTTTMTDEPRGSSNIRDPIADLIAVIADVDTEIVRLSLLIEGLASEVEVAIRCMTPRERMIFRCFYIECQTWTNVGRLNNYSRSYVLDLHGKALKNHCQ